MRWFAPLCSLSLPLSLALALIVATPAVAQALYAGNKIAYQGRLELDGQPVDATVSMTFRFYSTVDSAAELGSFTSDVTPASGSFAVEIGPLPDAVFATEELWLTVEVDGALLGGRQRVIAAPRAARADTAGELTVTGTAVVVGNTASGDFEIGQMGHSGWAGAAHANAVGPNSYALLQNGDGSETLVNAASGGQVKIRTGNVDRVTVNSSGDLSVSGSATVGGNVDVQGQTLLGYAYRSCDYPDGAQHGDCSCQANERVLSGGTHTSAPHNDGFNYSSYSVRESRPIDERTWRVACVREFHAGIGFNHTHAAPAAIDCGAIDIICARVGN